MTNLREATTEELLDELAHRNLEDQAAEFRKTTEYAAEHIRKLRLGFSLRTGGLAYKRTNT